MHPNSLQHNKNSNESAYSNESALLLVVYFNMALHMITFIFLSHCSGGEGLSPALVTCETSQVLLGGVPGAFLGVLPFSPMY